MCLLGSGRSGCSWAHLLSCRCTLSAVSRGQGSLLRRSTCQFWPRYGPPARSLCCCIETLSHHTILVIFKMKKQIREVHGSRISLGRRRTKPPSGLPDRCAWVREQEDGEGEEGEEDGEEGGGGRGRDMRGQGKLSAASHGLQHPGRNWAKWGKIFEDTTAVRIPHLLPGSPRCLPLAFGSGEAP